MNNVKATTTKTKRNFGFVFVLLFFSFLVLAGVAWKAWFWFDKTLDTDITEYCRQYEVDKSLVFAVIKSESNFDKTAISSKGAVGLMQLMPQTAEFAAEMLGVQVITLTDTKQNLQLGIFYLSYLQKRFASGGTVVAAYNAGETVVSRWLQDKRYSEDGSTLKNIPYRETQKYVSKVNNFRTVYQKLY